MKKLYFVFALVSLSLLGIDPVNAQYIRRDPMNPNDMYGNPRYRDSQGNTYTQPTFTPNSRLGGPNLVDKEGNSYSCGSQRCVKN
jgi:hypothetical protein